MPAPLVNTAGGSVPNSFEPTCLNPHFNTSAVPFNPLDGGRLAPDTVDLRDAGGPENFLLCIERCSTNFTALVNTAKRETANPGATVTAAAKKPLAGTEATRFRAEITKAHMHSLSALTLLKAPIPRVGPAGALLEVAIAHIWRAAEHYDQIMPIQPRGYFRFGHFQRESFHAAWAAENALSRARTASDHGDLPTAIHALEFATRNLENN